MAAYSCDDYSLRSTAQDCGGVEGYSECLGRPSLAAARELTKLHEEFYRGTVSGCLEWLEANSPRGEFCLVLGAGDGAFAAADEELEPLDEVRKLMADGVDKKAALAQVAKT